MARQPSRYEHYRPYNRWHAGHRHYDYYGPYYNQVSIPGTRDDAEIKRDIEDSLFWDTWVDAGKVQVEVENGLVTLTGTAASIVEKRAAEDDAWDVPGVIDVRNKVCIRP
ncbi:MAG: BON domain-containing protein [Chloroflexi bacterium]|nr:BON domain-containing protein [Chloroflexota bacterium]